MISPSPCHSIWGRIDFVHERSSNKAMSPKTSPVSNSADRMGMATPEHSITADGRPRPYVGRWRGSGFYAAVWCFVCGAGSCW